MRRDRRQASRLELAVDVLTACMDEGHRARELLAERFGALDVPPPERRAISRAVYRAIQQRRRADFAVGGLDRLPPRLRAPALLVATLVMDGALTIGAAAERMAGFGGADVDWRRVADAEARIARVTDPVRRLGLRHSMPDWIAGRLLEEFADEADALATALAEEPPRTIRANLLRVDSRETLAAELDRAGVPTRPTRFAEHGLHVDGDTSLFELEAFRAGRFEQQDEASQLCAEIVAPPPRGKVLDACAGGGGKALALASAMRNRGEILAVDVHERRLRDLVARRRRAGVDVIRSLPVTEDAWPPDVTRFAHRADRIVLDVPCSGVGSWRRRTDARFGLTPEGCASMRRTQRELLERAIAELTPGARIVYATCTVFRDENEGPVEAALATHSDLELVRVTEILGGERAGPITDPGGTFLKLLPHVHGTDGFFAAVLRRRRRASATG